MKKWIFEVEETKKGGFIFKSKNTGFTALELTGILALKLYDIQRQITGEVNPKVKFDRTVIVQKRRSKKKKINNA